MPHLTAAALEIRKGMETFICVCATGAAVQQALSKFGSAAVGFESALLGVLLAACWAAQGRVRSSPLYRNGAESGVLVGCMAVPVLIMSLTLLHVPGGIRTDLEIALFYLRLAIACSGIFAIEGVLGDGAWGHATPWRHHLRLGMVVLMCSALVAGKEVTLPWPIPLGVLCLALGLMRALLRCSPFSFTLGEASIISTASTLLMLDFAALLASNVGLRSGVGLARSILPVDIAVEALIVGTLVVVALAWPVLQALPPPSQTPAPGISASDGQLIDRSSCGLLWLATVLGFLCLPTGI